MAGRFTLALALLATAATRSAAAQVSAAQVLVRVSSTYRGLQTYQLNAVEREFQFVPGLGTLSLGQANTSVAADAGGKMRVYRQDDRGTLLFASDGETTWVYDSALHKYTQEQAALDFEGAPDAAFADQELHLVGKALDTIRIGRAGRHLGINTLQNSTDFLSQIHNRLIGQYIGIEYYDPDATLLRRERIRVGDRKVDCYLIALDGGERKLWVDERQFMVVRNEEVDRFGGAEKSPLTLRVELTDYRIGGPLPPHLFEFAAPAGVARVNQLELPGLRASLIGKPAPDFTLSGLKGESITLSSFLGKVVLLDFWATWCGPCRREQPVVEKVYAEHKRQGLALFGINAEDQASIRHYIEKAQISFPTLMDSHRVAHGLYRCLAIPMLVVINRQGVITAEYIDVVEEGDLLAALKEAGLTAD